MRWTDELRSALDHEFNGHSRVMMLATVDAAGAPHVRCLVCRRIDEEGRIYAAIDARTQKDPQLRSDHRAEILFWLPNSLVQFRITGEAKILTYPEDELLHKEIWRR